jgi:uncharacterized Zn ribbon protein|tara:strand:+ start:886 stop:1077 length:192 start_codon:yes stop_codon:yes gene_type:complete
MKVVLIVKEIKVKGYYRKNGTWVGPHVRKIQITPKDNKSISTYYRKNYTNPDQLKFDFIEKTD